MRRLTFAAFVALGFLLVPTSWLEALPSVCLFRNLVGMDCPGCGMIRAISCACHGEFLRAWHFNRGVVVVLPLLVSAGWPRKQ